MILEPDSMGAVAAQNLGASENLSGRAARRPLSREVFNRICSVGDIFGKLMSELGEAGMGLLRPGDHTLVEDGECARSVC